MVSVVRIGKGDIEAVATDLRFRIGWRAGGDDLAVEKDREIGTERVDFFEVLSRESRVTESRPSIRSI